MPVFIRIPTFLSPKCHSSIRILASLSQTNIIGYKEAFFDEGTCLCIITEFAEGGDILAKIEGYKKISIVFYSSLIGSV